MESQMGCEKPVSAGNNRQLVLQGFAESFLNVILQNVNLTDEGHISTHNEADLLLYKQSSLIFEGVQAQASRRTADG